MMPSYRASLHPRASRTIGMSHGRHEGKVRTEAPGASKQHRLSRARCGSTTASYRGCSSIAAFSRKRNKQHPILERVRFLSISASNLDEFYMVRAAGIYGQIAAGVTTLTQDGLTPKQQLTEINRFAARLVADKQNCWNDLKTEMAESGMRILEPGDLSASERLWLQRMFMSHVFPILTPIAVDPAHPFPFILNKGLVDRRLDAAQERRQDHERPHSTPGQLERFIRLGPDESSKEQRFIQLEQMIGMFIAELFPGFDIKSQGAFRVLRRQ